MDFFPCTQGRKTHRLSPGKWFLASRTGRIGGSAADRPDRRCQAPLKPTAETVETGQDWGSLIGLRLAAENPDRFDRIVVGNGFLPTGDQPFPTVFKIWRAFARWSPMFPISRIVDMGTRRQLTGEEKRAYDAPFPGAAYKAGARAFPALVPTDPNNPATPANRKAWEVLETWTKPFLTTFSSGDPITRGADKWLRRKIPGCEGMPHKTLRGGHFLQEDSGPEFAAAVNELIASTP